MPDVFLSYNREDTPIARTYADALAGAGLEVWWDTALRSGEAYDEVTESSLRAAKAVVVLWSKRSVNSRWVRAEATLADRNRTLVPARIEACDLPIMFELTQTADLSHWHGEAGDPVWLEFLCDVRRMVGHDAPKSGQPAGRAPAPAASSTGAGVPQAGVLPFIARGGDGGLEVLAEDLGDEVTRAFAENDYFNVIAAGKMAAWRGKAPDYEAIGRMLNVRYLAEGKLQRSEEAIRLTVQLIDTETANSVWSHRFTTSAAEIDDRPEDFPGQVAFELAENVLRAETKRAIAAPAPHSAWEHVVRAMAFSFGKAADGPRCIAEARAAVAAAPGFGLSHAILAGSINTVTAYAGKPLDDELKRELHEHVAKALQLDGNNPAVLHRIWQAHISLGDGDTMLRIASRLVELRPHSPVCHRALAGAYFTQGRTTDAIAASSAALRCKGHDPDPEASHWMMGWCHLLEGQPLEAEAAFDRTLSLLPNHARALQFKAIAEALLGKERAALATVGRLRDVAPDVPLDELIYFMKQNPRLARRSGEHIEIMRRLWNACENVA